MLQSFIAPDFVEGVASFVERREPASRRSPPARSPADDELQRTHPAELDRLAAALAVRAEARPRSRPALPRARRPRGRSGPRRRRDAARVRLAASTTRRAPAPSARRRRPGRPPPCVIPASRPGAPVPICPVHCGPPQRQLPYGRERSSETIAPRMSAGCRCVPEMSGRSICHTTRTPDCSAREPRALEILQVEDHHVAAVAAVALQVAARPRCPAASARSPRGSSPPARTPRWSARTRPRRDRGTARPGRVPTAARRDRLELAATSTAWRNRTRGFASAMNAKDTRINAAARATSSRGA